MLNRERQISALDLCLIVLINSWIKIYIRTSKQTDILAWFQRPILISVIKIATTNEKKATHTKYKYETENVESTMNATVRLKRQNNRTPSSRRLAILYSDYNIFGHNKATTHSANLEAKNKHRIMTTICVRCVFEYFIFARGDMSHRR